MATALLTLAAKATAKFKAVLCRYLDHVTEERIRHVRFEREMYRGAYRHSSKNDDDLPLVR